MVIAPRGAGAPPARSRPSPPSPPVPQAPSAHEPAGPAEDTIYEPVGERPKARVVAVLVGVEGRLEGQVYRIFDGENKLGRDANQCQVVLDSGRISREHALLIHQNERFTIKPLRDRNPTIVNDKPTSGTELEDGDYLKLGADTFRFRAV